MYDQILALIVITASVFRFAWELSGMRVSDVPQNLILFGVTSKT